MSFPMFGFNGLFILSIIVQLFFGLHAVRTGRFGWLFIILFFPFLGCLIYFVTEYYPEMSQSRGARRFKSSVASSVASTLDPGKRLRELEAKLRLTPSFANRQAVADAYLEANRVDEAIALYLENSSGIHADEPGTLKGLALAYFKKGDYEKAKECALKYKRRKDASLSGEIDLLYAELLEKTGDAEGAAKEYLALAKKNEDEESRYRAAILFRSLGREEEAQRLFGQIVENADLMSGNHRRAHKQWIELARRELKR